MPADMLEATNSRVFELSEELTKCNKKLHKAGSLGINLLEDKRKLEEEMTTLKTQYSKLLEDSEKDKYDLQQKMWEVKSERDSRIAELEDEVNELHHLLTEREQAAEIASRDSRENQDSKQLLEETIRQLTYSLEKVKEEKGKLHSQLSVLTQKLCEEEGNKEKLSLQQLLQDKMDELQRENLQQKQEISELQHGRDNLVLDLRSSQDNAHQLEQQLQQKEELLIIAHQELTEMQDAMKQLQVELNQQVSQALNNSSVSLYEELNIRKESLQAQDCDMANDIVEIASYTCSNCAALMEKLQHSQKETEKLNKQILELIKQKLNMAQQLEMWEGDVESLVGDQVVKQLKDEKRTTKKEVGGIINYLSRGIKKVAGAKP